MRYILSCDCSGQKERAAAAYQLIFPQSDIPEAVVGKEKIAVLASRLKNDHIKSISKVKGIFSYYIELADNRIKEEYDLVTGRKIQ